MHTRNITLKEYCRLSGYSYQSKGVNRHLQAGNLTVGMVSASKFGNSWMITVLESWYQVKSKEVGDG
jgi:hypothetical protein